MDPFLHPISLPMLLDEANERARVAGKRARLYGTKREVAVIDLHGGEQ